MEKSHVQKILNEFANKNMIEPSKITETLENFEAIKQGIMTLSKEDTEKIKKDIGAEKLSQLNEIIKSIK